MTSFNVSDDSMSFRWDEVPCGSRGGVIVQYTYQLSSARNTGDARNASANEMSVRIDDDILPCTNYTFEVAAVTVKGPGPYSNLSVTTSTGGKVDVQIITHVQQINIEIFYYEAI